MNCINSTGGDISHASEAQSVTHAKVSGYGDNVVVSVLRLSPIIANRLPILSSVGFASLA